VVYDNSLGLNEAGIPNALKYVEGYNVGVRDPDSYKVL
jgi:hypothetical protein